MKDNTDQSRLCDVGRQPANQAPVISRRIPEGRQKTGGQGVHGDLHLHPQQLCVLVATVTSSDSGNSLHREGLNSLYCCSQELDGRKPRDSRQNEERQSCAINI